MLVGSEDHDDRLEEVKVVVFREAPRQDLVPQRDSFSRKTVLMEDLSNIWNMSHLHGSSMVCPSCSWMNKNLHS